MMDTLTQAERERLTNDVNEAHNQVLHRVRSLSGLQLGFKENPTRWSIGEIVEHLTIVHNLVLNHVEKIITEQPTSKESDWKGRDDALLERIRSRDTPLKVPEIGGPKNEIGHQELFQQFDAIRDRIVEFVTTTNAPLRSFCFPHPIFGEKDCYQWLLGTAAHCERHLAQIREVNSTADFPEF